MGWTRFFERKAPPPARFLEERVGYAVGDVHGRADLLTELIAALEERAEADKRAGGDPIVIFLGDYVDRGRESRRVLDILLEGGPRGFTRRYLKGNHEDAMLAFMAAPLENRAWVLQGGAETLLSYGVQPPPPLGASDDDWRNVAAALNAALPDTHREFLHRLERYIVQGDYAFVHAGVDVNRPLEQQTDADLYWIRERFLSAKRPFSHRIVHGHTPVDRPYADQRRVAVDTGAYASGTLTAARFEGADLGFLSVSERDLRRAAPAPVEDPVQF